MDQIATLKPWGYVFLAVFLGMWAVKRFVAVQGEGYEKVMAILAFLAGLLLLIPG
jgi:hypothetical protein